MADFSSRFAVLGFVAAGVSTPLGKLTVVEALRALTVVDGGFEEALHAQQSHHHRSA
jgi:hypothetical protein